MTQLLTAMTLVTSRYPTSKSPSTLNATGTLNDGVLLVTTSPYTGSRGYYTRFPIVAFTFTRPPYILLIFPYLR